MATVRARQRMILDSSGRFVPVMTSSSRRLLNDSRFRSLLSLARPENCAVAHAVRLARLRPAAAAHSELAGWRQSIVSGDNRLYAAVHHLRSFSGFAPLQAGFSRCAALATFRARLRMNVESSNRFVTL